MFEPLKRGPAFLLFNLHDEWSRYGITNSDVAFREIHDRRYMVVGPRLRGYTGKTTLLLL